MLPTVGQWMKVTRPDISQYPLHRVTFKKPCAANNFSGKFHRLLRSVGDQRFAGQDVTGKLVRGREAMILIEADHILMGDNSHGVLV